MCTMQAAQLVAQQRQHRGEESTSQRNISREHQLRGLMAAARGDAEATKSLHQSPATQEHNRDSHDSPKQEPSGVFHKRYHRLEDEDIYTEMTFDGPSLLSVEDELDRMMSSSLSSNVTCAPTHYQEASSREAVKGWPETPLSPTSRASTQVQHKFSFPKSTVQVVRRQNETDLCARKQVEEIPVRI
jgi:hypothetical protein